MSHASLARASVLTVLALGFACATDPEQPPPPPTVSIASPANGTTVVEGTATHLAGTAEDSENRDLSSSIEWNSSIDGALGSGSSMTVTFSVGNHTITARVTDSGGRQGTATITATIEPNPPPTVTITEPGMDTTVAMGEQVTLAATAMDAQDGDVSASLVWSSDRDGDLGTGVTVQATLSVGTHTITARAEDSQSAEGTATRVVTVTDNTPPDVTIVSPAGDAMVTQGTELDFEATATDAEDGNLAADISWSSDLDGDLGTGATVSPTLSLGTHEVTATVQDTDGASGADTVTVMVSVSPPPDVDISAPVNDTTVIEGTELMFTATATDAEDGDLSSGISWVSDLDGALGTGASVAATLSLGIHEVIAGVQDSDGQDGADTVTVAVEEDPTPVVEITQPANNSTVGTGTPITFEGTATDTPDGDLSSSIAWASDVDGALGIGASVNATLSEGTHLVTATVQDDAGQEGADSITMVVEADPPPVVEITAPSNNATVIEGTSITFTATATDTPDGDLSASLTWTSDVDGALGTGANVSTTLSGGTHQIIATVDDSEGSAGADTIVLNVVTATPLSFGDLRSSSIAQSAETDFYTFTAPAGADVLLLLLEDSGFPSSTAPVMTVLDPDGDVVIGSFTGMQVRATLPDAGVYVVRVQSNSPANPSAVGNYTLGLEGLDPLSPDTLRVGLGALQGGSIDSRGETDLMVFDATAGDDFFLTVWSAINLNTVQGTLYAPSGQVVGTDFNNFRSRISLTETGLYRLRVRSSNLVSTGSYVVGLEGGVPLLSPDTVRINLGDLRTATISGSGDADFFVFDGTAGDDILMTMVPTASWGSASSFPQAIVYGPAGDVVIGTFTNTQVRATLPNTGLYAVRIIGSNQSAAGTYALGFEGLDPLSPDTLRVGLGALQGGSIDALAETDLFVFDGTTGENVFLTVWSATNLNTVQGTLFGPSGQVVGTELNNQRARITLPATGRYTLRVKSSNHVSTGSYVVGLEGGVPLLSPDTVRINVADVRTATISNTGDVDYFVFDATAGDDILVTMVPTAGFSQASMFPQATVYGPTGDVVVGTFTTNQVRATLPTTGLYAIRILGSNQLATGTYALGLEGLDPLSPDTLRIGLGALQGGSIDAAAQTDLLVFDGTSGDNLFLTVWSATDLNNVQGTLFGPAGQVVGTDLNNQRTRITLTTTGRHTLRVKASNHVSTGSYVVGLEGGVPLLSPDTVRINRGDLRTATISSTGDADFYVFDGTAGDDILMTLVPTAGFSQASQFPQVIVYGPTGDVVLGAFTTSQERATLPTTGLHAVRVIGSNQIALGTYALGFEGVVPSSGDAIALTVGGGATPGSIDDPAETDMFTFGGTAGNSASITLAGIAGFSATATLYDPNGSSMLTFTPGTQSIGSLPSTGTYVISIRATNLVSSGSYNIQVQ